MWDGGGCEGGGRRRQPSMRKTADRGVVGTNRFENYWFIRELHFCVDIVGQSTATTQQKLVYALVIHVCLALLTLHIPEKSSRTSSSVA